VAVGPLSSTSRAPSTSHEESLLDQAVKLVQACEQLVITESDAGVHDQTGWADLNEIRHLGQSATR